MLASNFGTFSFHAPTKITFGLDTSQQVVQECKSFNPKKILLVTDPGIEQAGVAEIIRSALKSEFVVETFREVEPEPRLQVAEAIAKAARDDNYDIIVGVGGGSALDMAKIAALTATNPGPIRDYTKQIFNADVFPRKGLPMVMLPTTAGTGSEVSPTSMLIVEGVKIFVRGSLMIPDVAIVDPRLTMSMPKKVTAATGLDALAHSVEGYLSKGANPITDAFALQAISLIGGNLRRAYDQGDDLEARTAMSYAALVAGLVLGANMIYGHSVAYTIATRFKLPHGVSTAFALPYVMEYNLSAGEQKLGQVARVMGEKVEGLPQSQAARTAVQAVAKLTRDLGIPASLKELGATPEVLKELAEECISKYPRPTSPRPMDANEALQLYKRMYEGKLES